MEPVGDPLLRGLEDEYRRARDLRAAPNYRPPRFEVFRAADPRMGAPGIFGEGRPRVLLLVGDAHERSPGARLPRDPAGGSACAPPRHHARVPPAGRPLLTPTPLR